MSSCDTPALQEDPVTTTTSSQTTQTMQSTTTQSTRTAQPKKITFNQPVAEDPLSYPFVESILPDADENAAYLDWHNILSRIPDDQYQSYPGCPTMPLKATIFENGEATELSVTDPRLVRMMNFFFNELHHRIYAYTTGSFPPKDIVEMKETSGVYLEVEYDPDSCYQEGSVRFETHCDKILVLKQG